MKEIMAKASSEENDGVASFEFIPSRKEGIYTQLSFLDMFNKPLANLEEELLNQFSGQKLFVNDIYRRHSVNTNFTLRNYKSVILKMEEEGKVTCYPSVRRIIKGKKTLNEKTVKVQFT